MPIWGWLILAAAGIAWLSSKGAGAVQIPPGAATYKIAASGAAYYPSDPSAASGTVAQSGMLAANTVVYATAATPVLSADQSYELILAPGTGQVWVQISNLVGS
jgi:hypothetical protein